MALDFYQIDNTKQLLFQIDDAGCAAFEPVLKEFKKMTGLYIDQYSSTRIYPDHVRLLMNLLDKAANYNDIKNEKNDFNNKLLRRLYDDFSQTTGTLIAVGD